MRELRCLLYYLIYKVRISAFDRHSIVKFGIDGFVHNAKFLRFGAKIHPACAEVQHKVAANLGKAIEIHYGYYTYMYLSY